MSLQAKATSRSDAAKQRLVGCDRGEIADIVVALGENPLASNMRASQLWHWLYHRGAKSFTDMTTLSKDLRGHLAQSCDIAREEISLMQTSEDGTYKWLLRLTDGQEVESVFIPEDGRGALCLSSQVGCTLSCRFCHTGTQRLVRNLTSGEIVGQILIARDSLCEWPAPQGGRLLSNIVVMGMGEPLYNYGEVAKALKIAMDPEGLSISRRRITLSTAGVVPQIEQCGQELGVNLAVSLHAVTDELRDELVPLNRKYPISELLKACRKYPSASNARRITFEYVMLNGVNDSPAEARELVRLISGIPAKINLIPFNSWPGAPYEGSNHDAMAAFASIVNAAGYSAPIRTPRGRDIMAACGQLKSASIKRRASK